MDPHTAPNPRAPAPYGRACVSCARAKSKCFTSNTASGRCERCHRLSKECLPAPAVRRRRVVKGTPANKTARLEEKLDGLVSLLQSTSKAIPIGSGNDAAATVSPQPLQSPRSDVPSRGVSYRGNDLGLHLPEPLIGLSNAASRSTIHNSLTAYVPRGFEPLATEGEANLETFKHFKLKYFPFIALTRSLTAQELRKERPFLWFCIMAVCSKSSVQQIALGNEIRTIIGRQLLLEGERSLDLLLGLLIYISWRQSYNHNRPIVSSLIQLAVALLVDLSLNKPPPKISPHMMLNYDAQGCPRPFNPSARTMEERRAAIACYSLNATISSYFQRLDPPHWTAYLEECLQKLIEDEECETDRLLACLLQFQLITDKAAQAPWHDRTLEPLTSRAPATFYLKALETQLQDFKSTIPTELQQNETLLLHLHSTTLSIHEIALSRSHIFPNNISDSLRLDSLYTCLHATKCWFGLFLAIPPAQYIGFPMVILTQMAHCIIALYRLSTFSDACTGWDIGLVRETLDFSATLGRLVDKVSRVRSEAGMVDDGTEENDVWCSTERRLGGIKSWWDGKALAGERRVGPVGAGSGSEEAAGQMLAGGFWDESWLDILGLRDYQF